MDFLLTLHGEMRWLVALVGVAACARYATAVLRGLEFGKPDRVLSATFVGLMDLNLLLGLILFFGSETEDFASRVEHLTTMVLAVFGAHALSVMGRRGDSRRRFRVHLIGVLVVLALVAAGVLRLRGGW